MPECRRFSCLGTYFFIAATNQGCTIFIGRRAQKAFIQDGVGDGLELYQR
jgi:hypothetical protein